MNIDFTLSNNKKMLKIRSFFWINGLFFILLWMLLFFQPSLSLRIIIIITSIEIMISWLIWLFVARTTTEYNNRKILFIISIITLIAGFFLLCIPEIGEIIASIAVILLGIAAIVKWVFLFIDWLKAKEAEITNRRMFPIFWILVIFFWIFLVCNAFLTLLVINVLLWLALTFLWILLLIRWFQAKQKTINWMEELSWIEDYDDSDD